jgi:hypothetical protein
MKGRPALRKSKLYSTRVLPSSMYSTLTRLNPLSWPLLIKGLTSGLLRTFKSASW